VTDEPDVLPETVRSRVVVLAASALGAMQGEDVPGSLRPFARFTTVRRIRHGSGAIAAALSVEARFRQRVGAYAIEMSGELGAAVAAGQAPAAADPVEVAALAYLLRPEGWADLVTAAADAARTESDLAQLTARAAAADRLTEQLERLRTQSRSEVERARAESSAAREESSRLRSRVQELTRELKSAETERQRAIEALSTERGREAARSATAEAELRRIRTRLAEAEAAIAAVRHAGREGRAADDARLWLLVESIAEAAGGLRRELALEPPTTAPADLVAAELGAPPSAVQAVPSRAFAADDPARLDQLLALPRVHLVVDGYNVTKGGYGDLSLEQQRSRLIGGLGSLAARSGAEVTVVFDGAGRLVAAPAAPRGVRVLFSDAGQTADEVIRRLVRAEPVGRSVVVVSSDREVADGVRRPGVHPVASVMLLRRLERS
jgi:predicted RNA-binding protein with PIN domain